MHPVSIPRFRGGKMATRNTSKKSETKGRRGNITAEAREKGAISKSQRGIFNKYIRALQGRAAEKNRENRTEWRIDSGPRQFA